MTVPLPLDGSIADTGGGCCIVLVCVISVAVPAHVLQFVECTRGHLVDPASSHMLVSKIKPCMP